MEDREAKDELYDGFADVAKALSNGRRAEIIDLLMQGERHVDEIATEIDQTIANTSFHLRALALAGLVTTRRAANRVYYQLASARVSALWTAVRDVAVAHHAELDRLADAYLGLRDGIEEVSHDELTQRIDDGDVIVIDVRPAVEYAAGHITGARSIPLDQLADDLDQLPKDIEVVAYCRGPFCIYADQAVRLLHQHGHHASRLHDGYPEWHHAGLPTTSQPAQ